MVKRYNKPPSELLHTEDEYTGYCLDEACAYILSELESGKEIQFKVQYTSFSQLYQTYER